MKRRDFAKFFGRMAILTVTVGGVSILFKEKRVSLTCDKENGCKYCGDLRGCNIDKAVTYKKEMLQRVKTKAQL